MNKATKSQKTDNKTAKIAGILVLLAVVILVILLLLRGCGSKGAVLPAQPETGTGISYDSAAVVGGWDEADMDKIVEGLNEQVEAGMINISMNTSPVFSDGTSEGNLMIVNEGVNRYPQIVEITRNDTGETIYKSGQFPSAAKSKKPSSVPTSTPVLTNVPHFSITSIPTPATTLAAPVRSSPLPFWTKFQRSFQHEKISRTRSFSLHGIFPRGGRIRCGN